ncbi:LppA-related lipoprotein [Mycoplasma miroungirhinis]|uniref:Lipoprotein n=1 Tax=Mycoplasma miroungirhinis TaxID=754516 RepID=A0A6M4JDJ3_9MOLU|nr:hypothetical protein [Mycoplasma miroungirhinis]QJR44136.1 hypothetical protein HLA92_01655 [Mycoplasma miroungirhinis]
MKKKINVFILTASLFSLTLIPLVLTSCQQTKMNKNKREDEDKNNNIKQNDIKQKNKENEIKYNNKQEIDFDSIAKQIQHNLNYKNIEDTYFDDVSNSKDEDKLMFNPIENINIIIEKWIKTEDALIIEFSFEKDKQKSKIFKKEFSSSWFKKSLETQQNELAKFPKVFSVIKKKANEDSLTVFNKLKTDSLQLFSYILIGDNIYNKYKNKIKVDVKNAIVNQELGSIENIILIFNEKENVIKKTITIQGLKKSDVFLENNVIEQLQLHPQLQSLYPSFLGSILVFIDNSGNFLKQQKQNDNLYDWSYFISESGHGLINRSKNLNFSRLKHYFLKIKDEYKQKYDFKVLKIKANDLNGTLSMEIAIKNIDEKDPDYNKIEYKQFNFGGFRSLTSNIKPNLFDFYIQQNDLKEILNKYKITEIAQNNKYNLENNNQKNITNLIDKTKLQIIKNAIFNKLKLSIQDNENVYQLTVVDNYLNKFNFKNNNSSIYPLYLNISNNIIKDINFNLIKQSESQFQLQLDITLSIFPYVSNDFNDLIEQGTNNSEITWVNQNFINL